MTKHVLLAGVATLALSSAAFADSQTIYLHQFGAGQTATTTQVGGRYNHIGLDGRAFVQENGSGRGGNDAVIDQSGNSNLFGGNKQAYQTGTNNSVNSNQSGTGSRVELQQSGFENGRFSPSLSWTNGPTGDIIRQSADYSFIDLKQDGAHNLFNLLQSGNNNALTVKQKGSSNMADVQQGQIAGTYGSSVSVNQNNTGGASDRGPNFNYALLRQDGYFSSQVVNQTGSRGSIDFDQRGDHNSFVANQSGLNNTIGGSFGNPFGGDTPAAFQRGNDNRANLTQTGYANYALFGQTGNGNGLVSYQAGNFNTLDATQNGTGNTIAGVQYGTGWSTAQGNSAVVAQTGNFSSATYAQIGTANVANIKQR